MAGWSEVQDAYAHLLAGDVEGAKHFLETALDPTRQAQARAHVPAVKLILEARAKQAVVPAAKKAQAA